MIITRTPLRISLGGGGTDLPSYSSRHGGLVLGCAIDKYVHILLTRPAGDSRVILQHASKEVVAHARLLQHGLAREGLLSQGATHGVRVVSLSDVPAGSGLGSSGAFTVGLLKALHHANAVHLPPATLAEQASHLELTTLRQPAGKQDPYMAALGGLTVLEIARDGTVTSRPARVAQDVASQLETDLLLFHTGVARESATILAPQGRALARPDSNATDAMHLIKELGVRMLRSLEAGNVEEVGALMDAHWHAKKRMAQGMTNPAFDRIYQLARSLGALGGKLVGAGGGGFFLFHVPRRHAQFQASMGSHGLVELPFRFCSQGSQVVLDARQQRFPVGIPSPPALRHKRPTAR